MSKKAKRIVSKVLYLKRETDAHDDGVYLYPTKRSAKAGGGCEVSYWCADGFERVTGVSLEPDRIFAARFEIVRPKKIRKGK